MGGQADLEEAVLNDLDLRVPALAKEPDGAPVNKFPAPHIEFPASGEEPRRGDLPVRRVTPTPRG
jgi:hypothetical protein